MKCPACGGELAAKPLLGVEIDACPDCGGHWFDQGEMQKLIPLLAGSPQISEQDCRAVFSRPVTAPGGPARSCPRCGSPMWTFNYCYDSNILLDRCTLCLGLWMDGGELHEVIRYVKGHPKLMKMGEAIASHVADEHGREQSLDNIRVLAETAGTSPRAALAALLAALIELILRSRKD